MHPGRGPGLTSYRLGQKSGVENVTLSEAQMPNHTHSMMANGFPASFQIPQTNRTFVRSSNGNAYHTSSSLVAMGDRMLDSTGGSQDHNNLQPFLTMNFIIALVGIFPSRS